MPRNRTQRVYSVYHAMDEAGVFEDNVANAQAVNQDGISIYAGPVQYPKMLYHPQGEMELVSQGIMVTNRDGDPVRDERGNVKYAGQHWGVKNVTVQSPEEEAEFVGKGWHLTEAAARRINPATAGSAPPKSPYEILQEKYKDMEERLAAQEKAAPPPTLNPTAQRTGVGVK